MRPNERDLAAALPNRVEAGALPLNEPHIVYEILGKFAELGVPVKALPVVAAEWKDFCRRGALRRLLPRVWGEAVPWKSR